MSIRPRDFQNHYDMKKFKISIYRLERPRFYTERYILDFVDVLSARSFAASMVTDDQGFEIEEL